MIPWRAPGQDVEEKGGVPVKDSRRAPMELGGYRYDQWKRKLVEMERHILKELGFGFYQVGHHPKQGKLTVHNQINTLPGAWRSTRPVPNAWCGQVYLGDCVATPTPP